MHRFADTTHKSFIMLQIKESMGLWLVIYSKVTRHAHDLERSVLNIVVRDIDL